MSTTDRLQRKKYMGVWRWVSELTARMMSRFPNTVTRYMERKSPNMRGCSSSACENPRRRNAEIWVSLPGSMCQKCLSENRRNLKTKCHISKHLYLRINDIFMLESGKLFPLLLWFDPHYGISIAFVIRISFYTNLFFKHNVYCCCTADIFHAFVEYILTIYHVLGTVQSIGCWKIVSIN